MDNAKTYQTKDPMNVGLPGEKEEEEASCSWSSSCNFTPFIVSAEGLLIHEADAVAC